MHKKKLLLLSLSVSLLASCGSVIPAYPPVFQCTWKIKFQKFFCVNTDTKERLAISGSDSRMDGAQALSARDYKKSEVWVSNVKKIAEERCQ
jgi:hypothetical protein